LDCSYNNAVAINEAAEINDEVTLYPNPANSEFRIQNAELKIKEIEIYDMMGKRILKSDADAGESVITMNVAGLNTGIYMVKMVSANHITYSRLVIE
jgi:hypothetical protein